MVECEKPRSGKLRGFSVNIFRENKSRYPVGTQIMLGRPDNRIILPPIGWNVKVFLTYPSRHIDLPSLGGPCIGRFRFMLRRK